MPRLYKCRKCGVTHPPPTGKHCRNDRLEEELSDAEDVVSEDLVSEQGEDQTMMELMLEMRQKMGEMDTNMNQKMGEMDTRMQKIEESRADQQQPADQSGSVDLPEQAVEAGATGSSEATPVSLRQDLQLMCQAAVKLAKLQAEDSDEDDITGIPKSKTNGKKSGANMTAADTIRKRIDWPHFYVNRMTGGTRRKGVTCSELRVEEFVYGFLNMLAAAHGKWDYAEMIELLKSMMQDAMEFSWTNALTFYEYVGLDIEKGVLSWSNTDRIRELRMTYARTIFPPKKETRDTFRPALQAAPAGMKRACEHERDHPPFKHACSYCYRARSAVCRHAEEDCMRKGSDASKNIKPREA